jgi:hypothetical protein
MTKAKKKDKGRKGYPQHRYIVRFKTFPTKDDYCPEIEGKVIKYLRTSDLIKFVDYLDKNYPKWTFAEVFKWQGFREGNKVRLGHFSKNNRPHSPNQFGIKRWEL